MLRNECSYKTLNYECSKQKIIRNFKIRKHATVIIWRRIGSSEGRSPSEWYVFLTVGRKQDNRRQKKLYCIPRDGRRRNYLKVRHKYNIGTAVKSTEIRNIP